MLQTNTQSDPIVEILRFAYRRGLALRREQEEKNKTISEDRLESDILIIEQESSITEMPANEVQAKVG
jgi:hypothetical protein